MELTDKRSYADMAFDFLIKNPGSRAVDVGAAVYSNQTRNAAGRSAHSTLRFLRDNGRAEQRGKVWYAVSDAPSRGPGAGISERQSDLVEALMAAPGMRTRDLAQALGMNQTQVEKSVHYLHRRGLVKRVPPHGWSVVVCRNCKTRAVAPHRTRCLECSAASARAAVDRQASAKRGDQIRELRSACDVLSEQLSALRKRIEELESE